MSSSSGPAEKRLPLALFRINCTEGTQYFEELDFTLESSESERIALDQITKNTTINGVSGVESLNVSVQTSLGILEEELDLVIHVLTLMVSGSLKIDASLTRAANKVVQQLPTIFPSDRHFTINPDNNQIEEISSNLLTLFLSYASKTTDDLKSYVEESISVNMHTDDSTKTELVGITGSVIRGEPSTYAGLQNRNLQRLLPHQR